VNSLVASSQSSVEQGGGIMKRDNKDHLEIGGESAVDVDRRFFNALLNKSLPELDQILAEDFIIIDVMRGALTTRPEILLAIQSGQVTFEDIQVDERFARLYGATAVINGSTRMTLRFDNTAFEVRSRFTHVYCDLENAWRLVSAQGTRIVD
jgi:uncharacterized protein DUF4440